MTVPDTWLLLSTRAEHACSGVSDATACLQAQPNPEPEAVTHTLFPQLKAYLRVRAQSTVRAITTQVDRVRLGRLAVEIGQASPGDPCFCCGCFSSYLF